MKKPNNISYIDFIEEGGVLFPEDMYPVNKTFFRTINYAKIK